MHILSDYWAKIQYRLFPWLEEVLNCEFSERQERLIVVLEVCLLEQHVMCLPMRWLGRKKIDRGALARSFVAKAVYNLPTTECLIDRLANDITLRRICGFETKGSIPSSSTFSRAFKEFADNGLCDSVLAAMTKRHLSNHDVQHLSRDSTAVEAREKPVFGTLLTAVKVKKKRGRPKKGEVSVKATPTRLTKQLTQTPEEALEEISCVCNVGAKRDAKGNMTRWRGWKVHIDWIDGGLPVTVVTTSASVHDSQVAIPMARISASRVRSRYDLMDSAYDAPQIRQVSGELGHIPIIAVNKRRGAAVAMAPADEERFNERSTAERGNSRLKDHFGLRHLRVRGHAKAHAHVMFGIIALFGVALYQLNGMVT